MRSAMMISRRALTTSLLAVLSSSSCDTALNLPAAAAPAGACSTASLLSTWKTLEAAERLLPEKSRWAEAAELLKSLDAKALAKSLDACVEPKTLTEQAMNNAAFIVYYEEKRYNDLRLEPQTPGLRAEQNGHKTLFLRALQDTQLELAFLVAHPDDSDAELREFGQTALAELKQFLILVPGLVVPPG